MSRNGLPSGGLLMLWLFLRRKLREDAGRRSGQFSVRPWLRLWILFAGLACVCPRWAAQFDAQEWLYLAVVVAVVVGIRIATRRWRQ